MPKHHKRGRLIVFEGPDGVGKSTLSSWLATRITAAGQRCLSLSFPGRRKGSLGLLVYRLHHKDIADVTRAPSPTSLQLLHLAAHVDEIQHNIRPALLSGTTVVLDRYWWSLWAYGRANGVATNLMSRMVELEKLVWSGAQPTIFLIERTPSRATRLAKRLRGEYARLAAISGEHVVRISNNGSLAEARRSILHALRMPISESRKRNV